MLLADRKKDTAMPRSSDPYHATFSKAFSDREPLSPPEEVCLGAEHRRTSCRLGRRIGARAGKEGEKLKAKAMVGLLVLRVSEGHYNRQF